MPKSPVLHLEEYGDIAVLIAPAQFDDEALITSAMREMREMLSNGWRLFLLDFSAVQTFSSVAIGKIIGIKKDVDAQNGTLAICATGDVLDVLHTLKLQHILDISDNRTDALRLF